MAAHSVAEFVKAPGCTREISEYITARGPAATGICPRCGQDGFLVI